MDDQADGWLTHLPIFTNFLLPHKTHIPISANKQLVTVAVSADPFIWGFYKTGVINQCASAINHGVVVTGVKKTET